MLAAVSVGEPKDFFNQVLEPALSDLGNISDPPPGDLPILVRRLLTQLQKTHAKIFRENQTAGRAPSSLAITCAVAEEERIYFVKSSPAWICVLRGDAAYPVLQRVSSERELDETGD